MQTPAIGQLVKTHLPDPLRNGKDTIVPGVVVKSGATITVIRIRDLSAHIALIEVQIASCPLVRR